MKALFIIHEDDPKEYFEEMDKMKHRIHEVKGSWWVNKYWSDKFKKNMYEYNFRADGSDLGVLVK